jgi:hypothetical protein
MKRSPARIATLLLGVAALTGAMAAPANADTESLRDCPNGNVCIWVNGPFVGAPTVYGAPGFRNLNSGDHDNVSSWANKTRFQYCLFDNGSSVLLDTLAPGQSRGGMRPGTNDRADSIGRC